VRVAVTGGVGFVGRNLVRRLARDGHSIAVLAHRTLPTDLPVGTAVVRGSVDDVGSLKEAFAGSRAVFHLVGLIAETKDKTFEKTVTRGPANVVEACRHCGVGKIVYLSALGTGADARTNYHRSKYEAEEAIRKSGLDHVVLRASVIFGPGDGFVSLVTKLVKASPLTPVIGHGRYMQQPVFIDDAVEVMARSLTVPAAEGRIIDLVGPQKLEYREILAIVRKRLRKKRINVFIPLRLMKPVAAMMEWLLEKPPLTRDMLTMMEMGSLGDMSSMKELFGVEPITMEEGLSRYLR
jgi:uncharacterized protein YbjT (DUF2867 family)